MPQFFILSVQVMSFISPYILVYILDFSIDTIVHALRFALFGVHPCLVHLQRICVRIVSFRAIWYILLHSRALLSAKLTPSRVATHSRLRSHLTSTHANPSLFMLFTVLHMSHPPFIQSMNFSHSILVQIDIIRLGSYHNYLF